MDRTYKNEMDETMRQITPWLRARVEHGLLKVWLAESAPEYIKKLYRECYS